MVLFFDFHSEDWTEGVAFLLSTTPRLIQGYLRRGALFLQVVMPCPDTKSVTWSAHGPECSTRIMPRSIMG
jgi:hypothetical protein